MRDYVIMTDSCASLTPKEVAELGVKVLPLTILLDGKEYRIDPDESSLSMKDFHAALRNGASFKSSAANVQDYLDAMEPILQAGKDILYIAFSSGLSTTYRNSALAAEELAQKYPEAKIITIDSLCACRGLGLLVWRTVKEAKEAGKSIEETAKFVETERDHQGHWFMVDNLDRLRQGGRISAMAATFGGLLNIKPVMHCDAEGHLTAVSKVRGSKAAIKALADKMEVDGVRPFNAHSVFISNADCPEYVDELVKLLTERFGELDIHVGPNSPMISGHSGIGTTALFFVAERR